MRNAALPVGVHLHNWCVQHHVSLTAMARRVGCSPDSMRRIAGGQRPNFELAMKIEAATDGIVHRGTWAPPFRMPLPKNGDIGILLDWKPKEAPAPQTEMT